MTAQSAAILLLKNKKRDSDRCLFFLFFDQLDDFYGSTNKS